MRCRSAGWTVAIVDSRAFGGTCVLRGCDPKKVLVGNAEAIDWVDRLKGKGIRADALRVDWPELMRFKRSFTDPVPKQREEGFKEAGIDTFHGRARFVGSTAVQIGDTRLDARYVVIATGAMPVHLGIPGAELLTTSEQFLELDALPSRILFVGGGYISFELAHIAARAGAHVTILHRGRRPLLHFDPDLVDVLVERTRALGIDVRLEAEIATVERAATGFIVQTRHAARDGRFEADLVVHGAGRVPEIDDLDLVAADVDRDRRGVTVNEYLQSVSNAKVYAAGDAASSGPPLTPVAGYHGRIVADNLLEGNRRTADHSVVPSVVFTVPPLAAAGLGEAEARERGLEFVTNHQQTSGWYSSRRAGETHAAFKVLVEMGSGRLIGAHLLGMHAEEVINLFAMAMRAGLTSSDIKDMLFAYPTHASDLLYMV
ncbi:MAG: NAD(P)/FAD-dependent oxidoreductase [Luteitalea sp.]|nr:NAD(P)/FAD-dependent oxidoreductase [Luteitalea sp.]